MNDPYDTGTPKYSTATDIYDALREMASGEEIGILSNMFSDVSWDGQDYYYTDNGSNLVEQWENITDYGNKMWLMDIAAWQLSDEDANEWIYQIIRNYDLAKRICFKKLFVDNVLGCISNQYNEISEAFADELGDLDRNDYYNNMKALEAVLTSSGWNPYNNPYRNLCIAVYDKLKGLRLDKEKQLIVESRAMLTGYDDFMFGLKANQALYEQQEIMYQNKVAQLKADYENKFKLLLAYAEKQGVILPKNNDVKLLETQEV